MNKSVVVLIDIDDTMANLVQPWCRWLNEAYFLGVEYEDITSWNMRDFFPNLTEEQVFEPLHTDDFWESVEAIKDAPRYVKQLIDDGYDVYVCTASFVDTIKSKFKCVLGRYFPFIPWNKVIITKNKQLIKGDILIDDGIHNLKGGAYKKILMSAPHNRGYDAESNGMTRVNTWAEAYDAVRACAADILREDNNDESY